MAKPLLKIKPGRDNAAVFRYFRTLEARVKDAGEALARSSAMEVHEGLVARLPPGPYRESLRVAGVGGTDPRAYAVMALPRRRKARKALSLPVVLYVRPRRRSPVRAPEAAVLARFGPWTADTLPFFPDRRAALVVSRRVSEQEVAEVSAARTRDRRLWQPALAALGVRPDKRLRLPPKASVAEDVVFEALRMEFGFGGARHAPHWRPSLRRLASSGIRRMLNPRGDVLRPVMDMRYRVHKRLWPVDTTIPVSVAATFGDFQKKLGA